MNVDEEMFEEHLEDEEQEHNEAPIRTTASQEITKSNKNRKLLLLLTMLSQNFQRAIVTSRRRHMRRVRRRQSIQRSLFIQQMLEVESSFMELLPPPDENASNDSEISEDGIDNDQQVGGFFEYVQMNFSKEQWLDKFRMSKRTFRWLCTQFKGSHKHSIPLDKSIAIALYAFASDDDYRTIGQIFSVSRTTAWNCTRRFAETLLEKLGGCLIAMPKNAQQYQEIRVGFQQASNMPALAVGVLGLFELSVCCPLQRQETHIIMQALIDDRLLIRKVQVDTKRPTLFIKTPNEITKLDKKLVNKRLLPSFVVVPEGYSPLCPWLLQRYEEPAAPHEYDFNEAVDNLSLLRENAFRRIFGRWKILQRKFEVDPQTMELIALACFALHNLLEECEEGFDEKWVDATDSKYYSNIQLKTKYAATQGSPEAFEMRDFLARTISSTEM